MPERWWGNYPCKATSNLWSQRYVLATTTCVFCGIIMLQMSKRRFSTGMWDQFLREVLLPPDCCIFFFSLFACFLCDVLIGFMPFSRQSFLLCLVMISSCGATIRWWMKIRMQQSLAGLLMGRGQFASEPLWMHQVWSGGSLVSKLWFFFYNFFHKNVYL